MISRADASGLLPDLTANSILTGVRKSSIAMQLLTKLPNMTSGTLKQPVLKSLPIADFVNGDSGMKVTTNAAWGNKMLVAGEIAAIVPVPLAVIDDASYDIWGETQPLIVEQVGRVFDTQVFSARNPKAPSEWPDPIIPAAIAKANIVQRGTGIDIAEDINQLFGLLEEEEYDVSGMAARKTVKTALRGLRDTNGQFIYAGPTDTMPGTIYSVPSYFVGKGIWPSTQALAVAGDWSMGVYALRQDISFEIFREGVISDEDGKVIYNLMQQDMAAMRCVIRLAWQVADPVDIDRPYESAYPFAVLTPAP